mmetsp:Transcript_28798/g.61194  ORF Transcript_28798/g.61194 Transcript_28798/m.61194 type:complete len:289 (-) Transcript_28798:580-1446(-)
MKSPKVRETASSSSWSSKMKSTKSTTPTGSTPTSSKARAASGLARICMNSSLEICMSQFASSCSRICCSLPVTKVTTISSFSVLATALTTSQSTPISMFITVSAARRTKKPKSSKQTPLSLPISLQTAARLSSKVPYTRREYMDIPTLSKYLAPMMVSADNCVKAIAKTYMMMIKRHITKKTDRIADTIPLMRIMSSGMERSIRAMRDNRSRRKSRKMEAFPPRPPPPEPPDRVRIAFITQVSITIMKTRIESKVNHPSRRPFLFLLNALKRMNHSMVKYKQKNCSII